MISLVAGVQVAAVVKMMMDNKYNWYIYNGNDQGPVVISPDAHKSHDDLGLGPVGTSQIADENFHSLETIRNSHLGTSPHPERIDPDTLTDEFYFLDQPGQADTQTNFF